MNFEPLSWHKPGIAGSSDFQGRVSRDAGCPIFDRFQLALTVVGEAIGERIARCQELSEIRGAKRHLGPS